LTKKKILICCSNDLGPKIIDLLKKKYNLKIFTSNKNLNQKYIFVKNKRDFELKLKKEKRCYEFIILIYWPFLIKKIFFNKFKDSINFHPSYLPYLRGWYPHVHAKIKDLTWGVTLHQINYGIDTGDIWAQKKIKIDLLDDNSAMLQKGKDELFKLFKLNYSKIINKKIKKKKQNKKFKLLKKNDIDKYDNFDLKRKLNGKGFLKLFLSRSFKGKSSLNMRYKNTQYNLRLLITKII
jgi:methionyl-tRNA formyltransferase